MDTPRSPKLPERPDRYDGLPPSPYAPLFIEKLLLALIEENDATHADFQIKESTHLPSHRLRLAMKALFGVNHRYAPKADLLPLVQATQNSKGAAERLHELEVYGLEQSQTTSFSEMVGARGQTHSAAEKRTEYVRLSRKAKRREYQVYLHWIANVQRHSEEEDMYADLKAIVEIFKRWNICAATDPDKLALHSLSHSWPGS